MRLLFFLTINYKGKKHLEIDEVVFHDDTMENIEYLY
jgi:hypothetical protein